MILDLNVQSICECRSFTALLQHLPPTQRFICLLFTLFVVGILGVMTGMGSRGKVLVAVRDQRGEWVDCMGRLHHGYFVGLWRRKKKTSTILKTKKDA